MTKEYKEKLGESGNIIFVILIAVALFAALAYAVTNSTRNGQESGREKTNLEVSRLMNFMQQAKSSAQRLRLINGCTSVTWGSGSNSCRLDVPGEGAMLPIDLNGPLVGGLGYQLNTATVAGVGTTAADQILEIVDFTAIDSPTIFSWDTCLAFNTKLDVPYCMNSGSYRGQPDASTKMYNNSASSEFQGFTMFCTANTDRCDTDRVQFWRMLTVVLIEN